jgi:hypothetical protein
MKLNRFLVAIGLISLLYLILTVVKLVQWPPEIGHIATTLVAVLIVHILDHMYFRGEITREFEVLSARIVADVKRQTDQELANLKDSVKDNVNASRVVLEGSLNTLLAAQSESVTAMQKNSIRRIYSSRAAAASQIAERLRERNSVIRLMGVSLNDFFRGDNERLRDAWIQLSDAIQSSQMGEMEREIRILMVNPHCFGAVLRSHAESSNIGSGATSRLKKDVELAIDDLLPLEQLSANKKVRLYCRVYDLAPTMFLCHFDDCCFVQHYHFWTKRSDKTPMAVIEYQSANDSKDVLPMHSEMRSHFDVIWENASIPIYTYAKQHSTGVDEAAGQSGLVNIYNLKPAGSRRMVALMRAFEDQKEPFTAIQKAPGLSLQGISLKSFFSDGDLSNTMYQLIRAGKQDIRILFLDPDSEQARFRSYREHLLQPQGRKVGYQAFTDEIHQQSALYKNTYGAIQKLLAWVEEFSDDPQWQCKVQVKKYRSAPVSFLLQVGDKLLVEPYNYGKLGQSNAPSVLGDMPLFEFQRRIPAMFEDIDYREQNLPLRNPFQLVMNHFDFAFDTAIAIPVTPKREAAAVST